MSLIFCDSFDHYSAADGIYKYDQLMTGTVPIGSVGRRGTKGLNWVRNGLTRNIGDQTGIVSGMAIKLLSTDYISTFNRHAIYTFTNLCTKGAFLMGLAYQGIAQMGIAVAADGSMHVVRGAALELGANDLSSAVMASSAAGAMPFNQYAFVEMKVTPSSAIVRVNGVVVINYTGGSTIQNGMPSTFTQFNIGGGSNSAGWTGHCDDLYVFNTGGTTNNDFIGDVRVDYKKPNGVGNSSMSVIGGTVPAATRWQSVDEQEADGTTTFVSLENDNDADSYQHEDILYDSATVYGVQGVAAVRKDDSGLAAIRHTQRVNTIDDEGAKRYPAGGEFAYLLTQFDESADGAWDLTKFNDSEFGVKRVAP